MQGEGSLVLPVFLERTLHGKSALIVCLPLVGWILKGSTMEHSDCKWSNKICSKNSTMNTIDDKKLVKYSIGQVKHSKHLNSMFQTYCFAFDAVSVSDIVLFYFN